MLCAVWGSTWLAIRIGLEGAPPFLAAALRFVLAFVVLLPVMAWRRSKLPRGRTEWGLVAFVGVVLFTLDYGLIYWGENNGVESGLSAILFATFVFQTALFAQALLANERLSLQKLAGIGLGFTGILLIFRGQLATAGLDKLLPMLAIVLSATCAAISSVATKRWGHDTDPISFTALSMGVGAVGLAALSLAAKEPWAAPAWPEGILAIVYLALAGSVVTFVTYWWLLKEIEATSASYIAMVTPIVAVFLGFTVGNEVLDPLALVGTAITLAGIYLAVSRRLAAWARRRPAGAAPDPPNR
jgi:drug/metabolite transporter (DMT)-like permease